jgi:hypothetical protein
VTIEQKLALFDQLSEPDTLPEDLHAAYLMGYWMALEQLIALCQDPSNAESEWARLTLELVEAKQLHITKQLRELAPE